MPGRLLPLLTLLVAGSALAGGMFLPAPGARALGRAGSFVAGADDLESFYYNPAGLLEAGKLALRLDGGLVLQRVRFERRDSGDNPLPPVDDDNSILPIPLLAAAWQPAAFKERAALAFGAYAPYTGIPRYPAGGPQRYSLVSLDGTALVVLELAAAWQVTPRFLIGAGFQNMVVSLTNSVVLSGCTQLNCAPEDPTFDAPTQARVTSLFTPSGHLGAIYRSDRWRAGLAVQLPFFVHAGGTVRTRLPDDPQFDGAVVVGDRLNLDLTLPAVLRAGVELRPLPMLRAEVGLDYETWQLQDQIRLVPQGVYIDRVAGIGRYDLRPMKIDRSLDGVVAAHVGAELMVLAERLTLRAGYLYESAAVPAATLSVFNPDGEKHLLALGVGLRMGRLRVDVGYGHFFQSDRTVTDSRSLQLNPIEPSLAVAVGNGTYRVGNDVLAMGLEGRF